MEGTSQIDKNKAASSPTPCEKQNRKGWATRVCQASPCKIRITSATTYRSGMTTNRNRIRRLNSPANTPRTMAIENWARSFAGYMEAIVARIDGLADSTSCSRVKNRLSHPQIVPSCALRPALWMVISSTRKGELVPLAHMDCVHRSACCLWLVAGYRVVHDNLIDIEVAGIRAEQPDAGASVRVEAVAASL
jgi:hypothetical protein